MDAESAISGSSSDFASDRSSVVDLGGSLYGGDDDMKSVKDKKLHSGPVVEVPFDVEAFDNNKRELNGSTMEAIAGLQEEEEGETICDPPQPATSEDASDPTDAPNFQKMRRAPFNGRMNFKESGVSFL